MGQSKSKSNIKYAKLNCPSNPEVDSEDEIEIGKFKKSDEKPETPKSFTKEWYIGVGFATISGNA